MVVVPVFSIPMCNNKSGFYTSLYLVENIVIFFYFIVQVDLCMFFHRIKLFNFSVTFCVLFFRTKFLAFMSDSTIFSTASIPGLSKRGRMFFSENSKSI